MSSDATIRVKILVVISDKIPTFLQPDIWKLAVGVFLPSLQMSPLLHLFPALYCWAWHHMVRNIPQSAVPAVSAPNISFTPNLLSGGAVREAEKALMLYKRCSAGSKTLVLATLIRSQIQNTAKWASVKKTDSIPGKNPHMVGREGKRKCLDVLQALFSNS